MSDTQRTGNFTAITHLQSRVEAPQLQALFHQIGTRLQEATNDGRAYTYIVKIVANLTVEPWKAEIGEYVHPDQFQPNLGTRDQILESPDLTVEKRTFQPTSQGFQRIK